VILIVIGTVASVTVYHSCGQVYGMLQHH